MTRLIKENNSYVIQERFLWFWKDKTALNDNGNALQCTYSFDTLREALKYCDSSCMFSSEILKEQLRIIKHLTRMEVYYYD